MLRINLDLESYNRLATLVWFRPYQADIRIQQRASLYEYILHSYEKGGYVYKWY